MVETEGREVVSVRGDEDDPFSRGFICPKAYALKDLQSLLGKLNDIRVHAALAKDYAAPPPATRKAAPKAFAMGELTGKERAKSRDLLKHTEQRGKRLKKCRPFWA